MKPPFRYFVLLCLFALLQSLSPIAAYDRSSIPASMFAGCDSLRVVVIGPSVVEIGEDAFKDSENIDTICCENDNPPQVANDFPARTYAFATLLVPKSALSKYQGASMWKEFKNIQGSETLGIEEVEAPDRVSLSFEGGGICLKGLPEGATVQVYTISGMLVSSGVATRIEGLNPGAYIIKAGTRAFKVFI